MSEKRDLRSSGGTGVPGGEYANVRVSASLRVNGDLSCETLHCSGSARIGGKVECKHEVSCSGSVKIRGSAKMRKACLSGDFSCDGDVCCAEKFSASGSTEIGGSLKTGSGRLSGSCEIGGGVKAGELRCSGALDVGDNLEAEEFRGSGSLRIGGLLNAERIEITINAPCAVGDVGGSSILVKKGWAGSLPIIGGKVCLRTKSIEGDELHLEATQAEVVRGKKVYIGKGCQIACVEYSEELIVEGGSVAKQVRVD